MGFELERALNEWLAASRRAYIDPARDQRDMQEEHAAWRRVQYALAHAEPAAA